jgi:hypothetical protein
MAMKFGMHLYELWRLRIGLVVSLVLAFLVSLSSAYSISPSGVRPRALGMSTASTHVLVDNPQSVLLNLGLGATQLDEMSQRALLLGNVMSSLPVRQYIASRAGVPAQALQISSPVTPQYPRPLATDPQNTPTTTDLIHSNNEYRIDVEANPTVPILDIYTEASSVTTAKKLANAAVDGLRDYLAALGAREGVTQAEQVRLEQLGSAQGGTVTGGVNLEVALLSFLFVFALASVASLVIARVVRGWRLSAAAEKAQAASESLGRFRENHKRERATAA